MAGIFGLLMSGAGVLKDQYFNLTSLLLPGNGTNGATNNSFVDSSTANSGTGWPITRNGDTTQGTFSPFSQTGWSNYFGSSTANIIFASDASFGVGTGNFSVELSVNFNAWTGNQVLFYQGTSVTGYVALDKPSSGNTLRFYDSVGTIITYTWTPNIGQWYNIAIVRAGTGTNQTTLYIDGVAVATGTSTASVTASTIMVGGINYISSYNIQGYISNLRYSNVARTITNPTSFFSSDANTLLLTCRSNRFVDISGTPKTISQINGTTSVTPFAPFAPTQSYSASAVGGSGYFDGTGDYLVSPTNAAFGFATGDFTVQCWFYLTAAITGNAKGIFQVASAVNGTVTGYGIGIKNTQTIQYYAGATFNDSSTAITTNQWYHLTMTRSSGTVYVYLNGTLIQNGSKADTQNITSGETTVGIWFDKASGFEFPGYISGFRVVKGSVISEVVPTAPPTAVSGTSLILNFTNAGVVDATAKNVLETEGNAQISTAQSKWGGGSIAFDGTGDYLLQNGLLLPTNGDFTVEAWIRIDSLSATRTIFGCGQSSTKLVFYVSTSGAIGVQTGGAYLDSAGSTILINNWYHVALTRTGNTYKIFVDGTEKSLSGAGTMVTTLSNSPQTIGAVSESLGTNPFSGYIDDFRISMFRRYTANFTAPTAPFPVQ